MTADERRQLAGLEATVTNEFRHVNQRLDSHSAKIDEVTKRLGEIDKKLAVDCAVEVVREKSAAAVGRVRLLDREMFWRAGLLVIGAAISGLIGYLKPG